MMQYYLNHEYGQVWEISSEDMADLSDNPVFTELTAEQITFYLACKTDQYNPSEQELTDCSRHLIETLPINIQDYKAKMIAHLDQKSLNTAGLLSKSYRRENAKISLALLQVNPQSETIYDATLSMEILTEANRIGTLCRVEFLRVEQMILNANTVEEVDAAFNSNQYHLFTSNE